MRKNTIFFGNRKKYYGIFSYYCLKIVNNVHLKSKAPKNSPKIDYIFKQQLQTESNVEKLNIKYRDCKSFRRQQ